VDGPCLLPAGLSARPHQVGRPSLDVPNLNSSRTWVSWTTWEGTVFGVVVACGATPVLLLLPDGQIAVSPVYITAFISITYNAMQESRWVAPFECSFEQHRCVAPFEPVRWVAPFEHRLSSCQTEKWP